MITLQDPITQIRVRPAFLGYTVDVTFRGVDPPKYKWAWTADRAEAKGYAMLEKMERAHEYRAKHSRTINIECGNPGVGDEPGRCED